MTEQSFFQKLQARFQPDPNHPPESPINKLRAMILQDVNTHAHVIGPDLAEMARFLAKPEVQTLLPSPTIDALEAFVLVLVLNAAAEVDPVAFSEGKSNAP